MLDKIYGDAVPPEPAAWEPSAAAMEFFRECGYDTVEEFAQSGVDSFLSDSGYMDLVYDSARETLANKNRSLARKNRTTSS